MRTGALIYTVVRVGFFVESGAIGLAAVHCAMGSLWVFVGWMISIYFGPDFTESIALDLFT